MSVQKPKKREPVTERTRPKMERADTTGGSGWYRGKKVEVREGGEVTCELRAFEVGRAGDVGWGRRERG